ncbi:MAG: hypothetical protein Q4P15_08925 [Propionibacteriaceae bacterium]|nr:hypothetical protein [Propionibacteriaceae bacterium]
MGEWILFAVSLGVGVPLLLLALWLDARRRRRVADELASAPLRGDPVVDSLVPRYVTQDEVDAMGRPGARVEPAARDFGVLLGFGHLDQDFATGGKIAELSNAAILMVGDDVMSIRELLTPLAGASDARPLVVAAASFHPEVLATLKANRRVGGMPVVAVAANPAELLQLQDVVGGEVLSSADLKAGWLPPGALGLARSWRSDMVSTRVLGASGVEG